MMARSGNRAWVGSVVESLEKRQLLSGNFEWAVTFGQEKALNSGNTIATGADGSVYVAGNFQRVIDLDPRKQVKRTLVSNDKSQDVFLAKYNSNGRLVWAQRFGGPDLDTATALAIGPDGDLYLTGTFEKSATFGKKTILSNGRRDAFVARISPDGNVRWVGKVGGKRDDFVNAIAVDDNGDVFLSGTIRLQGFVNPAGGNQSIVARGVDATFVSRLNGDTGSLQWIRHYGELDTFESAQGLAPDGNGGVFVVGSFNRTVQFQPGDARFTRKASDKDNGDIYLGHLNNAGDWTWLNTFGGKGDEQAIGIARGPGGLYIAGTFTEQADFDPSARSRILRPTSDRDVFVARYTEAGQLGWVRQIGGDDGQVLARGLAVDGGGNVYVTGSYDERVDLDPGKGRLIADANKRSGTRSLRQMAAPPPFTLVTGNPTDSFLVKLNSRGTLVYARTIGGERGSIDARGLCVDDAGGAYLTGSFSGIVDLDPSQRTQNRSTPNSRRSNQVFILKLDA